MEDKITLYIAEHNQTGLKYFGSSKRHFTNESLQNIIMVVELIGKVI